MNKHGRILLLSIIALTQTILYTQDIDFQFEVNPLDPLDIGLEVNFGEKDLDLIEELDTTYETIAGYELGGFSWHGLGDEYVDLDDSSISMNGLTYNKIYGIIKTSTVLIEGSFPLPYSFNFDLNYQASCLLPIYSVEKSIYQSATIVGDKGAMHHQPVIELSFYVLDDDFWTTTGIECQVGFSPELGGELYDASWFYLTNQEQIKTWIPLLGSYLFMHTRSRGEFLLTKIQGTIPFFGYPELSDSLVRNLNHSYYNFCVIGSSVELYSRFLHFEIFCPMSLGAALFYDAGLDAKHISAFDINRLQQACGAFLEYKIKSEEWDLLAITLHLGIVTNIENNEIQEPDFYFDLSI